MNLQLNKKNQAGAILAKIDNLALAAAGVAVAAVAFDNAEIVSSIVALKNEGNTGSATL